MLHQQFGRKKKAKPVRQQEPHVRKGDTVMVISGKDRGKTGIVKEVITAKNRVLVEGLNMVKKSIRSNMQFGVRGGIMEMEAPLHLSKVMVFDVKANKPTRICKQVITAPDGSVKRVRVSKKSGEQLDD